MAEDYYKTLGVSREASQADIQKAYRTLARKYHPDLNPDDATAKKKFQEVQLAFDVLNDTSKRELYDRYGSSFESMGAGQYPGRGGGGGRQASAEDVDFSQFFGERFGGDPSGGFADIFSQFSRASAGGRRRGRTASPRARGGDLLAEISVPFTTAVVGGEAQLSVQRGDGRVETITVKIPAGIEDGKKIRLRGQGEGAPDPSAGDLLITVRVASHPWFTRRGEHLYVKVPVTLAEAALGAKVDVPTPQGTVTLRVPAGTSSGKKLRIKGHGVAVAGKPPGDLFADIQIMLPAEMDEAFLAAVRQLKTADPRSELQW